MASIWQDVRYGVRLLRRFPHSTFAVVLTLAIGSAANTVMFGVLDAAMFRTLPVGDPHRLVVIGARYPAERAPRYTFCYPTYQALTRSLAGSADLAAIATLERPGVRTRAGAVDGEAGTVRIGLVSGDYFSTLSAPASIGRTLTPEDERAAEPVAVVSQRFWRRQLGAADPGSATLTISGTTVRIVGVMPDGFSGEWVGRRTDAWLPISLQSRVMKERPGLLSNPTDPWVRIVGRLHAGASAAATLTTANETFQRWADDTFSPTMMRYMNQVRVIVDSGARGFAPERVGISRPLVLVMLMAALVLSIACANIANLLLARATMRERETSVRLAIGASRGRLLRQIVTEQTVLALAGALAGLLFTVWGMDAAARLAAAGLMPLDVDIRLDSRTLLFAAGVCVLTTLMFGVPPAVVGSSVETGASLKRSGGGSGRRFGPVRTAAAAQVALSLVLLSSAGLFVRTLHNLESQDLGFHPSGVLLVWMAPAQAGMTGSGLPAFYDSVRREVASLPGVLSAGLSHGFVAPNGFLTGDYFDYPLRTIGDRSFALPDAPRSLWYAASPGYLGSMGLSLLRGRDFSPADGDGSARVAIVSASLARRYFAGRDPIGGQIAVQPAQPVEIVGVVNDAKYNSPRDDERLLVFVPSAQHRGAPGFFGDTLLAVRTAGDPLSLAPTVRQRLDRIDPRVPILRVTSIGDELDRSLVSERLVAWLAGMFGITALAITCVGVYGVASYVAARRVREIGIRLALGAPRRAISAMMLGEGALLLALGFAVGVPATLAAGHYASALLYGVRPSDPFILGGSAAVMMLSAALALVRPAWSAARLDPVAVLKAE